MVYSYIYLSSAVGRVAPQALERILQSARARNQADGITGMLLFHDGNFMQFLEGPREAVLRCVHERIEPAPQHRGLITLQSKPVTEREFANWSMAYVPFGQMSAQKQEAFVDLLRLKAGVEAQNKPYGRKSQLLMKSFLSSFRDIREARGYTQKLQVVIG